MNTFDDWNVLTYRAYDFVVKPFDINVALLWTQVTGILILVTRHSPNLFIEVGVNNGGIGTFLIQRARYVKDFNYIGLEILPSALDTRFVADVEFLSNAELIIGDCFSDDVYKTIGQRIFTSGKTVVFCDGGNKPKEIFEYSKFLKIGDIILVHDYPGEVKDNDLEFLKDDFIELEPDVNYRDAYAMPTYQRIK